MDTEGLITELQIRGFDQQRVDSALRLLVHVYTVQDYTNEQGGGVLVKDILNSYPFDVAQVASELYFDRNTVHGQDTFRVKWGYEGAAKWLEKQVWGNVAARWEEYTAGLDDRFLGFFLPLSYEDARVVELWKSRKDLKWFGVESESFGWKILRMIDDIVSVGWALDLSFGFRKFGPEGIESPKTLIHKKAFESLKRRSVVPPESIRQGIKLWKFFTEYEPAESDVVELMKECGVSLEEVQAQVKQFYEMGITTPYRESQYPPYLIIDKQKKRYEFEVSKLLAPMQDWLAKKDTVPIQQMEVSVQPQQAGLAIQASQDA